MWEDLEVDSRISFKNLNRLIAPILQLEEEEEEHYTMIMFATL
jgi:hypothetical protein